MIWFVVIIHGWPGRYNNIYTVHPGYWLSAFWVLVCFWYLRASVSYLSCYTTFSLYSCVKNTMLHEIHMASPKHLRCSAVVLRTCPRRVTHSLKLHKCLRRHDADGIQMWQIDMFRRIKTVHIYVTDVTLIIFFCPLASKYTLLYCCALHFFFLLLPCPKKNVSILCVIIRFVSSTYFLSPSHTHSRRRGKKM